MNSQVTTPKHNRAVKLLLSSLFFIGVVVGVELWLGWQTVLAPWRQLNLVQVSLAIVLVFVSYSLRTMRLVHYFGLPKAFWLPAFKLMLQHNFWNNLLPMRSGEMSFPILMQQYFKLSPLQSIPGLFWFRLLDLSIIVMLMGIAAVSGQGSMEFALLFGLLTLLAIPLVYLSLPKIILRLVPKCPPKLQNAADTLLNSLPNSWSMLWLSCFWTLVNWSVKLAVFCWVLIQFTPLTISGGFLGAIGGELTSVLPIHGIAGVGTYEAGIIAALLPQGVDEATAVSGAVNLHLFLLSCTFISALFSLALPSPRPSQQLKPTT